LIDSIHISLGIDRSLNRARDSIGVFIISFDEGLPLLVTNAHIWPGRSLRPSDIFFGGIDPFWHWVNGADIHTFPSPSDYSPLWPRSARAILLVPYAHHS
jgi:hypothetical protein